MSDMRILIIEDDRDTAAYLAKAFREAGHVADQANDGLTGYDLALEGAYDETIAALGGGPAAESFESHGLNPCLPAKYSYNVAPAAA